MRTFPPAFTDELARRDGAAPVWLLKFTDNGVDYVLCQDAVTIGPWGVAALPMIASWGQLSEGVSNTLVDYHIGDLSVNLINSLDVSPNLRTMAKSGLLFGLELSVYLWFDGLSDPPHEMYRFRVRDIDMPSESQVNLGLQDESIRYENYYPGTVLTAADYPDADPDDVGKVIPMVFGNVEKLRTLSADAGIKTSLAAGMSATQITMTVSDENGFWAGMWVAVDDETMLVTAINGTNITVTRAYDTTVATTHQRGADLIEIRPNDFVYLVADHVVTEIGKVWVQLGNKLMDVTTIASKYNGQTGNTHGNYPGRAVVSVPGFITISQAAQLMLVDGIGVSDLISVLDGISILDGVTVVDSKGVSHTFSVQDGKVWLDGIDVTDSIGVNDLLSILDGISVADSISVSDTIGILDAILVGDTIGVTENIAVSDGIGVNDPGHYNAISDMTITEGTTNTPQLNAGVTSGYQTRAVYGIFNNTAPGNRSAVTLTINVEFRASFTYDASIALCNDANGAVLTLWAVNGLSGVLQKNYTFELTSAYLGYNRIGCYISSSNVNISVELQGGLRTIRQATVNSNTNSAGTSKTGTATKTGTTTKTGGAARSGSASKTGAASKAGLATKTGGVSRSGAVLKTGSAVKTGTVSPSGTIALAGGTALTGSVAKAGNVTRAGNITRAGSVAKTGTVALAGNSVANTLIGDAILVDVVGLDSAPAAVVGYVLGIPCELIGQFPPGYAFDGVINSSRSSLAWCHELARQCRAYFRWILGQPTLIVRPDALIPVKSITEIRLSAGEMIHGQKLTDINEVINTINLQYNRDWSGKNEASPYKATFSNSDQNSITTYGVRERPELFKFDFVTSDTMAANLLAFYLNWQAWQRWQHTQEAYLFEACLEFGDAVELTFLDGEVGECIEVGFNPGSGLNIDKIQLTVIE